MLFHKGYSSKLFRNKSSLERVKTIWMYGTILYTTILYLIYSKVNEKKMKLITYIGILYFVDLIALGIHYKKSLVAEKNTQNELTTEQIKTYNILKMKLEEAVNKDKIRAIQLKDIKTIITKVDEGSVNIPVYEPNDVDSLVFPIYESKEA